MQETINRIAAIWVKSGGYTLQDLWKFQHILEEAIIREEKQLEEKSI